MGGRSVGGGAVMFNMLRLANLYIRTLIRGVLELYLHIQSLSHTHKNHHNCYYYFRHTWLISLQSYSTLI